MAKKQICFAITDISDNGVARVLSILLDTFDYGKYDVTVLLTRKKPRIREFPSNVRILEVPKNLENTFRGRIENIRSIHRLLKPERFDVIVALGDYAAMYVLLACYGIRAKKIVSERNDPNREPDKKTFRILRNILYRYVNLIVCQTKDAAEYFEKIVQKRVVIPNPISANLPRHLGRREKYIVNFCRIDRQKNLPLLFDAFLQFHMDYPEYRLKIYGDGPLKEEMQQYIRKIHMEEWISLKSFCLDIHEQIKDAAMFVSSSDFEGMSNSMLEAMAVGIPTICTDCPIGGAREVIENGVNGWLVPVGDKKALAEAMCFVAGHPKEAESVAAEGMKIRRKLSKEIICGLWQNVIDYCSGRT